MLFKVRTLQPVTREVVSFPQRDISFYMATAASVFREEVGFSSEMMAPDNLTTWHLTN